MCVDDQVHMCEYIYIFLALGRLSCHIYLETQIWDCILLGYFGFEIDITGQQISIWRGIPLSFNILAIFADWERELIMMEKMASSCSSFYD